jgi:hypothetical protein
LNKPKIAVEEVPKSRTQHSLPKLLTSQGNASKEENGAEASPLPGKSLGFSPGNRGEGRGGEDKRPQRRLHEGDGEGAPPPSWLKNNQGFPPALETRRQATLFRQKPKKRSCCRHQRTWTHQPPQPPPPTSAPPKQPQRTGPAPAVVTRRQGQRRPPFPGRRPGFQARPSRHLEANQVIQSLQTSRKPQGQRHRRATSRQVWIQEPHKQSKKGEWKSPLDQLLGGASNPMLSSEP